MKDKCEQMGNLNKGFDKIDRKYEEIEIVRELVDEWAFDF